MKPQHAVALAPGRLVMNRQFTLYADNCIELGLRPASGCRNLVRHATRGAHPYRKHRRPPPGETVRDFFIDLLGDGGHDPRRPTVVYQDEDFIFGRQDWPPPWRDESLAVAIITVVERGS